MEQNFCAYCMNPASEYICEVCKRNKNEYKPAPHHLKPGTIIGGKYVVGEVLGEGGFGITYIGRETNLNMKVAIKEYFPSGAVNRNNTISSEIFSHTGEAQTFFENGKRNFLEEARTLAKFSNESSIVSVQDFFSENNTAYIVMEYLEGTNLKDYIEQNGKMTFEQTITMLTPVMKSLSRIHAQGLIHRDISPANIMILTDGTVKLLDFGAAREFNGDEKSLSILLKPGFAPEEQYRTKGYQGPWTDVYALSATMYKMITGATPLDAMNRVFSDDLVKISQLNPSITPKQESVILNGMALQQADRYQTIDKLCLECQAALSNDLSNQNSNVTITNNSWINAWDTPQIKQQDYTEKAPNKDNSIKGNKKPKIGAFIGSIVTGILTLYFILTTVSQIIEEVTPIILIILAIIFGTATFFLGRMYFPRIDNKKRKPNTLCLILSIIFSLVTLFCAFVTYLNFTDVWAEEGAGAFGATLTLLSAVFPVFFGYFYYPRLERKKKVLLKKISAITASAAVILFVVGIILISLNTVTIGSEKIKRNATSVSLSFDIINNNDMHKLKELKNLESLYITGCFLDDEDVKIIGELTQLKELTLDDNTDITNVSPLKNLINLTHLDISNTKTTDISCLDKLVKLETLNISKTKASNLSVLSNFTKLDTLYIDSIDGLDVSTISLPSTVYTLYCSNNKITSLDFVLGSESLANIYAANNNISDLTPLSKYKLNNINLSANNISDLSPLNTESVYQLDLSTNVISDISCLKGSKISSIDLGYNQISDLSALADNYQIISLNISNNRITDIGCLKDCFKIHSLNISFNNITDISALETIDNLEILEARGNNIIDISPLASCKKLIESGNTLDFRDNRISNITVLSNYVNTSHIYLSNNNISDISPLQHCVALEMLKLNNNQISDIAPLSELPALYILQVANNPITSLASFVLNGYDNAFLDTSTLTISYNEGIDFEALAENEHLIVIVYGVPPRQESPLREYGFSTFIDSFENNEEVEENSDLAEVDGTTEEDANG